MTNNNTTRPAPTITDKCGTWTGYRRHARRKEQKCEPCALVGKERNRQKYLANRKQVLASQNEYRQRNREEVLERKKRYYKENKDKVRAGIKDWEARNPDKVLEYARKWRDLNREKFRAESLRKTHRRNAEKRNTRTEIYTEKQVLEFYGSNCNICSEPIDLSAARSPRFPNWQRGLHIDHLIPLSKGGTDTLNNVRPTHALCNIRKAAKLDDHNTGVAASLPFAD